MKPMLSATCNDVYSLQYPLLASPKLDGIRALILDGQLVSRNLKPIRNKFTFDRFSGSRYDRLDGELIYGEHDATVFRRTTSAISRFDGEPLVTFHVFDIVAEHATFEERQTYIHNMGLPAHIQIVPQCHITSPAKLLEHEQAMLDQGYEGVMIRSYKGLYKYGRATAREGSLLKLKRFEDAEAEIIGFEERMHNANTATTNALGHTERSSHQENMVGRNDLGALVVRGANGTYKGVEFNIGTGFDDNDRDWFWAHQDTLKGAVVKYKYFPTGSKDAPRFPVFLGLRPQGL